MSLCSAGLMTIPMDVSASIMTAKYRLINDYAACGGSLPPSSQIGDPWTRTIISSDRSSYSDDGPQQRQQPLFQIFTQSIDSIELWDNEDR